MNQIDNLKELRQERRRLKQKLRYHQHEIKVLADELNPVKQISETVSHILPASPVKNNAVRQGIAVGIDWVVGKVLLRKAPFILKIGVPFVVRRLVSAYMNKR
jgi:hypothetical protein